MSLFFKLKYICLGFCLLSDMAQAANIQLPEPDKIGGMPLMQAITVRRSTREFSPKEIDLPILSNILYAAWGVSHEDKRTIPTALNQQDLTVYAFLPQGVYMYDGSKHLLIELSSEDNRAAFATQEYAKDAPLVLLYSGKQVERAGMHAGSAYQNVGLYAASAGLNNVVRGYFDKEKIKTLLPLTEGETPLISQSIGWPKE